MAVDVPEGSKEEKPYDYELKLSEVGFDWKPVLAEFKAEIGKKGRPQERSDKCQNTKKRQIHIGDSCRQAYKCADNGKKSWAESYSLSIFLKPR